MKTNQLSPEAQVDVDEATHPPLRGVRGGMSAPKVTAAGRREMVRALEGRIVPKGTAIYALLRAGLMRSDGMVFVPAWKGNMVAYSLTEAGRAFLRGE